MSENSYNFITQPAQDFERYGFFILYILGLLYSGYAFYIIVDFFLIPACNNISKFVTRIIKNTFIANLVMISASCTPELFIGIIGFLLLKEMVFPSAIIFGCTLVNSLLQAGVSSLISLDNVVVTKSVFVRDATFFVVSVIIIYFFSSNFTLDSLEEKFHKIYEIEIREGSDKKCLEYCSCCKFCKYYQDNYMNENQIEKIEVNEC